MASVLYPKFKEKLLKDGLALSSLTLKAVLIDSADESYNSADEFLSDITSGGIVGTAQTLGSKTFTNGTFDAADITFSSVTGDPCEAILIYADSGSSATSRLIAWIDSASGLPVTPNGGDITVAWNASGIVSI